MKLHRDHLAYFLMILIIAGLFLIAGNAAAASGPLSAAPTPSVPGNIATAEQLAKAQQQWAASGHSETYDNGMGANTTCAKCKAPQNWDPDNLAQEAALNCASCKRVPGAPRPELSGGTPVVQADWKNIGCAVCHQPVGNSYSTGLSFWNQATGQYEPVANPSELCAHCHEGSHGFQVMEEQAASKGHKGWACTKCHGSHNSPVKCTDCHDPAAGKGAADHARHPTVNCTACHDAGNLTIWVDDVPGSKHLGQVITRRFGHALRSWPSHDIQAAVDCFRCHHPVNKDTPVVAAEISCQVCHPEGESFFWCIYFPRNPDPLASPTATPPVP